MRQMATVPLFMLSKAFFTCIIVPVCRNSGRDRLSFVSIRGYGAIRPGGNG
ncbi:hypothetical protein PF005_g26426 [Phytophthora fragariae]|uniref:RxLR effector protein n=2 Tax=Phytophthora TaxID=4783 RepID=A0A6A3VXU5_9STRA|nr:hypothetical protein PF003_g29876 [Phytophthora fragariae]KAE8990084.1 hypothetical protein PR002_g21257 [Phytophthora rubi]KAE8925817.1 hypothetical protein PF009_g23982 [Phytophthora fragariae]KAE8973269.1 hypothetical protein PF011_g25320 [Phytophthora fragariae]KAE8998340.1 hypothetical protein PR001_g19351 [Phytophthora rubi]